jgi:xanthine dehydrogenase FAD-binding subunit
MFDISKYYEAKSLKEAKEYLNENENLKIVAGGTDVLIRIREGKMAGISLMGISRIKELNEVSLDSDGSIHVGPMATFSKIENDKIINEYIPYLGQAVGSIGGPQIRNIATIGGNVCNGATSADSASTLFCLNAKLKLESAESERTINIEDFYLGPSWVDLKPNEILTDIIIEKKNYEGYSGKFMKFAQRNAMDIATIGCAVVLKTDGKIIEDIRIACGVAAPTPVRCINAEKMGKGMEATPENIDKISKEALSNTKARDSWRGSKAFRQHLVVELARRGMMELCGLKD